MRVVIAGSSGLIGTSLVPALRHAGHEVIRLVRRRPQAPDERGWNPISGRLDDDALEHADAVVNLCGVGVGDKRWTAQRKRLLLDSRIRPTAVLAEAVAKRRVPALLNASAVGYYGDSGAQPVTETSMSGPGFLADLCRQWEAATGPASEAGARVVVLRSGPVISPSGGIIGRLKPLFALGLGARMGSGQQYLSWISLDDEVSAIRFLSEHPEISGAVNVTGPAPVTNTEFTRALADAMGRPAPWIVPGLAIRMAVGELGEELLGGQRALPTVLEAHGFTFQHPSIGAALSAAVPT